ncbi:hypothetical protein DFH09DRAFT_1274909 [Mycena vulgaris]|nr:hypothetical protein DFH09DRAFT_1274909 [Mycena vulgaris]
MDAHKSDFSTGDEKIIGSLRPITSHGTGRYETSTLVEPLPMIISAAFFTSSQDPKPEYLPRFWSAHVDPEGQLYFYCEGPLRVITEAYLYRPETLKNVCLWIDLIQEMLSNTKTPISGGTELFIKLEDDDCAYYFVDHVTRTQFWLESSDTDTLGLPPVISISQLKIVLEELYWIHVEHFPMHLAALSTQTLDDLIAVFSHGVTDQMTSRVSTFLYTAQECSAFVTILQGCRGNMANGHTTWIIARLWSIIYHHKYMIHHGQEHPRLSRDQSILFDPVQKYRWISNIMASVTFKTSEKYQARLDDVFVDHIVYVHEWERLMGDCLRDWRGSAYGALSGLLLNLPFLVLKSPCPALLAMSVAVLGSGLGSSIILRHKYEPMKGMTATEAMYYLDTVQSPVLKFQPLAFVFSLPTALRLWGFMLFLAHCALTLAHYFGIGVAMGFTGMALWLILFLYCTTSEAFHTLLGKCIAVVCRRGQDAEVQMV